MIPEILLCIFGLMLLIYVRMRSSAEPTNLGPFARVNRMVNKHLHMRGSQLALLLGCIMLVMFFILQLRK